MVSADFTANGNAVPPELAVAGGSLVTLSLLSASGVDVVEWKIIGSHSHLATNPVITPAGTPLGKTATFTMPAGPSQAYLIQCQINGGVDSEGTEQASYTKTALVGVVNPRGVIPFAFGENFERSATHGTTEALNVLAEGGDGSGDFVGPGGATAGHLISFASGTGKAGADSGIASADVVKRDGSVAMTGDLDMDGNSVTGAADAVAGNDLTTLQQVETLVAFSGGGGGGDACSFTFDVATADADPGAGKIRINNLIIPSVTQIYVSTTDYPGSDITNWLDRMDDTSGAVKGYVRIATKADPTRWIVFRLTGVVAATGYRKLQVEHVAQGYPGAGSRPTVTVNGTTLMFDAMGAIDPDVLTRTSLRARAIATSNVSSLSGLAQTFDGIALDTDGQVVLLVGQTDHKQNGPWVVHSGAWTRPTWFATGIDVSSAIVIVQKGTVYADSIWLCTTDTTAIVGTDNLVFVQCGGLSNEVPISGTAIDWTLGTLAKKLSLASNTTFTWTNPPAACVVQLHVSQDNTGGRTVTLPTVTWLDGITWQPNPTASSHSVLPLFFDGTNWYGYGRAADSRVITESTTARTFGLGDIGAYIRTTNGSGASLTMPPNSAVPFPPGALITGIAAGGQVTFVQGSGVTINKQPSRNRKTNEQFSPWSMKQTDVLDVWDLSGDLELA